MSEESRARGSRPERRAVRTSLTDEGYLPTEYAVDRLLLRGNPEKAGRSSPSWPRSSGPSGSGSRWSRATSTTTP